MLQRQRDADEAAEVVADHVGARDAERGQQRDDMFGQARDSRRFCRDRAAAAGEVRYHDMPVIGEQPRCLAEVCSPTVGCNSPNATVEK